MEYSRGAVTPKALIWIGLLTSIKNVRLYWQYWVSKGSLQNATQDSGRSSPWDKGGQSSRPWDKGAGGGGASPWPLPWIRHCKSFGDILIQWMRAHTDRSQRDLQSYLQSCFGKENTVKWTRTPERIHLASFAADIAKVQYASFEHIFMLWLLESRRHQYKVVVPRPRHGQESYNSKNIMVKKREMNNEVPRSHSDNHK